MSTSLFEDVIFGPVHSRRLGLSLGVNLLPLHSKICTFNCIYCECGWNTRTEKPALNPREKVRAMLELKLSQMRDEGRLPDVITFAGNGEPTMHPDFENIIDDTIKLRDRLAPDAKVSVLSNATMLHRPDVVRALGRVDNNILKLDSAFDETVRAMNQPQQAGYTVERVVENMRKFDGRLIVQTERPACGQHHRRGGGGMAVGNRANRTLESNDLYDRPRHARLRTRQGSRSAHEADCGARRGSRHSVLGFRLMLVYEHQLIHVVAASCSLHKHLGVNRSGYFGRAAENPEVVRRLAAD